MLRRRQHGALDELDLGLLPGILKHSAGRLQLLAVGTELPHEDREI